MTGSELEALTGLKREKTYSNDRSWRNGTISCTDDSFDTSDEAPATWEADSSGRMGIWKLLG